PMSRQSQGDAMMSFFKVSFILVLVNLFGCGVLSKKLTRQQAESPAYSAESSESKFENAFQGVWKAACDEKPDAAGNLSTQFAIIVTNGRISMAIFSYSEPSCRGPASIKAYAGTYSPLEKSLVNPSRQRVAVKFSEITALFQSQIFVDALNKSGYCGYHDWKVNEAKPVNKSMPNCILQEEKSENDQMYFLISGNILKVFNQDSDAQPVSTLSKYE
ncbi:MAG: hypothetical protein NTV34_06340, partial [Proteobacteria bacterium]|nr:hypothetical protein [Pseudomonadota bacterium]